MRSGLVKPLVRGVLLTASSAGPTPERRSSKSGASPPKEELVMADLRTRYLGLELHSPLVASSSPLTPPSR